ncbi:MAG: hypothetical protein JXJ19_07150 [Elusimicrobia bacterium]|nr:hypothetical protein [Elusimicrobiota bacterium]
MIQLLIFLAVTSAVSLEIYPDKKEVSLGEKVKISMMLQDPAGRELKGIELENEDVHVFKKKIGKDRLDIIIGAYKLGEVEIPVKIFYAEKGKAAEAELPGFRITVKSSSDENSRIRPIKDVVGIFNYYIVILLLALTAAVICLLMRKKKAVPEERVLTPLEWAQKRLQQIKEEDLPGKKDYKGYYDALSNCIRVYLEKKYAIKALESTLSELQAVLKERFSPEIYMKVRGFLEKCDWIKFAPEGEDPGNIEDTWQRAYGLVTDEL